MMTIPRDKYNELKPFYDFQRQKEFNKDWCRAVVQKVSNLSDGFLGHLTIASNSFINFSIL